MKKLLLLTLLFFLMTSSVPAIQTQTSKKRGVLITGIYSNLRFIEEAGDVVGREIMIVGSGDGFLALVQQAEGVLGEPVLVPVIVTGKSIEFVVPERAGSVGSSGRFKGKITSKGLTGKFDKDRTEVFLRRGKSYWQ